MGVVYEARQQALNRLVALKMIRAPSTATASDMARFRQEAFQEALDGVRENKTVLTNCPSCLSGLGRNAALGLTVRHLAEELARCIDGEKWLDQTCAWRERAQVVGF